MSEDRQAMLYWKARAELAESELGKRPKGTAKMIRHIIDMTDEGLEEGDHRGSLDYFRDVLVDIQSTCKEFLKARR